MNAEKLKAALCGAFCAELSVQSVPAGLAFSGIFDGIDGDRVSGYVITDRNLPYLSDDGSFLAELEASGVDVLGGARAKFLENILSEVGAYVDEETLTIRSHEYEEIPDAQTIARFLVALTRSQDVAFWSRERVKSTFSDDLFLALQERLGNYANIERSMPVNSSFADFPADILVSPHSKGMPVALFLAQNIDRLNEATLFALEMRIKREFVAKVIAVTDTGEGIPISNRKVKRSLNRIDSLVVFQDDEEAAISRIASAAGLDMVA